MNNKEVLLFSGGVDSYIAWYYLGNPNILYVDMGTKFSDMELKAIDRLATATCKVIEMSFLSEYEKEDADIPARNMYLALRAASEGYDKIWMVFQKDETSIPDRTKVFCQMASDLLSYLFQREIIVDSPFWNMDKEEMVRWYISNQFDVEELKKTVSCYNPIDGIDPCANCPACFRKFVALSLNGVTEDWYQRLVGSDIVSEYKERAEYGKTYSEARNKKTLEAIKLLEDYE
jgi:7-cyano-7-deazaguanine synthase